MTITAAIPSTHAKLRAALTDAHRLCAYYWQAGNTEQEAAVREAGAALRSSDQAAIIDAARGLQRLMNHYWAQFGNTDQQAGARALTAALDQD